MRGRWWVAALSFPLALLGSVPPALSGAGSPGTGPGTTGTDTAPTLTVSGSTTGPAAPAEPVSHSLGGACVVAGALALLRPGGSPLVVGPVAHAPPAQGVGEGSLVYPADGSIVSASTTQLGATRCGGSEPTAAEADVGSLSLFAGEVTADSLLLRDAGSSVAAGSSIAGLRIEGQPVSASPGARFALSDWGYLITLGRQALEARLVSSGLAVHVVKPHDGLAAGTVLLLPFVSLSPPVSAPPPMQPAPPATQPARPQAKGALPARRARHAGARKTSRAVQRPANRKRKHVRKRRGGQPLKITPPLGLHGYVFPVAGPTSFVDTYGAGRSDVPGGWHHGDDLFAALGTPVVAVADGTLNRVGWERIGGWRLWVRDRLGNEFYYAHLSGYTPLALHARRRVRAGQVLGFVGDTGDAFSTPYHLHFEIHPHQLLSMHYAGAVDPTTYLEHWRHLTYPRAPRPVLAPLPGGPARSEARLVFRRLLAARGLIKHPRRVSAPAPKPERGSSGGPGQPAQPFGLHLAAPKGSPARGTNTGWGELAGIIGASLAGIVTAAILLGRRRRAST